MAHKRCEWCSEAFTGKPGRRFCSTQCAGKGCSAERRAARIAITPHTRRVDREANADGITRAARRRLLKQWKRQTRLCAYCEAAPATTVDHLIPLIRGGTNYEGNLVPACLACNSRKQDRLPIEFRLGKRASSTYQPFRERPRAQPKPKPVKPVAACYICGAMYVVGKNRRTCGGDCAYEHAKRIAREAYRARVGLEPTWHIPVGEAWKSKRAA